MSTDKIDTAIRHNQGKPKLAALLDFRNVDIYPLLGLDPIAWPLFWALKEGYVSGYISAEELRKAIGCYLVEYNNGNTNIVDVLAEVNAVSVFGGKKYAPRNWQKGMPVSSIYDSALRHCIDIGKGEVVDSESQLPHIGHFLWNCWAANWMVANKPEWDDRNTVLEVI